jgi:hypothetical protein
MSLARSQYNFNYKNSYCLQLADNEVGNWKNISNLYISFHFYRFDAFDYILVQKNSASVRSGTLAGQ